MAADSFGDIDFDIIRPQSGIDPLPEYQSFGSTRHVANSNRDVTQYTGTGAATVTYHLYMDRTNYDAMIDLYRAYPRFAATLTTVEGDMGNWFIDQMSGANLEINGNVFVDVRFKEAPA